MAATAAELASSPVGYCNGLLARRGGQKFTLDVIVTPAEGGTAWQLTDLLGRSMGRITASVPRQFMILSAGPRLGNYGRHTARAALLARRRTG